MRNIEYYIKQNESLRAKLDVAILALTSIASLHRTGADHISHWLNLTHENCAQTNASDTIIAREALAQIQAGAEGEK